MKKRIWIFSLIIGSFLIANSCKKDDVHVSAVLTTSLVTDIAMTTAICGGNITSDGGSMVTARGVCWSTGTTPTIANNKTADGSGTGIFTSNIAGLEPGITYNLRAYATNIAGTGYGNTITFTTQQVPTVTTSAVNGITITKAISGGNITLDGGSMVTARGVCWSTATTPTIADSKTIDGPGTGIFTSIITGLSINTTYNLRAYATNNAGTGYGNSVSFKTLQTVTDIDGNVYHPVIIGTQVWMVENLKVTKYKDGTPIPLVTNNTAWSSLTTAGYSWYNNDAPTYENIYGVLYNWYTVNTGKLCPTDWHVPTDSEWTILTTYLGSGSVAAGKLRESGTTHWLSPNSGATNESGFTALPGGNRSNDGSFYDIGRLGYWWSSSQPNASNAWFLILQYDDIVGENYAIPKVGLSVRCLVD